MLVIILVEFEKQKTFFYKIKDTEHLVSMQALSFLSAFFLTDLLPVGVSSSVRDVQNDCFHVSKIMESESVQISELHIAINQYQKQHHKLQHEMTKMKVNLDAANREIARLQDSLKVMSEMKESTPLTPDNLYYVKAMQRYHTKCIELLEKQYRKMGKSSVWEPTQRDIGTMTKSVMCHCEICDISMNSWKQMEWHFGGLQHSQRVAAIIPDFLKDPVPDLVTQQSEHSESQQEIQRLKGEVAGLRENIKEMERRSAVNYVHQRDYVVLLEDQANSITAMQREIESLRSKLNDKEKESRLKNVESMIESATGNDVVPIAHPVEPAIPLGIPVQLLESGLWDGKAGLSQPHSSDRGQSKGVIGLCQQRSQRFKTIMCRYMQVGISCLYGVNCDFAHSKEELRPKP